MTDHKKTFQPDTAQQIPMILHRRKMLVVALFLFCFSVFALVIQSIKPVYVAHAQIAFEGESEAYIKTQQHFIKSLVMAREVVNGLNLFGDTDFNTKRADDNAKFKKLSLNNSQNNRAVDIISKEHAALIYNVLAPLTVTHSSGSFVLNLSYTHHDPDKAAQILGAFVRHYIAGKNIDQITNLQPALGPITDQQSLLEQNLNGAILSLEDFKSRLAGNLSYAQKTQSKLKYKREKANVDALKALIAPFLNEDGTLELNPLASVIRESQVIHDLETEKKKHQRALSALSLRYGEKHPKIQNINTEIENIEDQINQESKAIMLDLKIEYDSAQARLKELEAEKYIIPALDNRHHYATLNVLEANLSQAQALLSNMTINQAGYPSNPIADIINNIRVITPATVPALPIYPNKVKLTAISFIASFMLAALIVIMIERNRKTFLSGRQIENALHKPCYALIPNIKGDKNKALADYVLDHPGSDIAEAMRTLHLNIKLLTNSYASKCKVVMMTSSKPNEGKTTLCAWLARLSAKSGARVLLIDADLRTPSVHSSLGQKNKLSLVDYLSGKSKPEDIIDTKDPSGMHVIYGSAVPNSALDLVSSRKMDKLVLSLKNDYDLIIIDTPACMAVSDARALFKNCDLLLYAVAWHKTRREVVHNGLSQFTKSGNQQIATVLSNIDVKKHVQFGYGEVVSDYGAYKPA